MEERNIAFETIEELLEFLNEKSKYYVVRNREYACEYTKEERTQAKAIYEFINELNTFITDTYLKKVKGVFR